MKNTTDMRGVYLRWRKMDQEVQEVLFSVIFIHFIKISGSFAYSNIFVRSGSIGQCRSEHLSLARARCENSSSSSKNDLYSSIKDNKLFCLEK